VESLEAADRQLSSGFSGPLEVFDWVASEIDCCVGQPTLAPEPAAFAILEGESRVAAGSPYAEGN
jgi:hypothetical protein